MSVCFFSLGAGGLRRAGSLLGSSAGTSRPGPSTRPDIEDVSGLATFGDRSPSDQEADDEIVSLQPELQRRPTSAPVPSRSRATRRTRGTRGRAPTPATPVTPSPTPTQAKVASVRTY